MLRRIITILFLCLALIAIPGKAFADSQPKVDSLGQNIPPQPSIPQLTTEEKAVVKQIVLSDDGVKKLLDNKKYAVTDPGVWVTKDYKKIGGTLEIIFDQPFPVDQEWPAVACNDGNVNTDSTPYTEGKYREALNVKKLNIRVDFQKQRVVDITPLDFGDVATAQKLSETAQTTATFQATTASHNLTFKALADGDMSWNYDFIDQNYDIDWPVTIIFCGPGATVQNIKNHYWSGSGGVSWGQFKDVGYWEWDGDTGTKSTGITSCHMRLYAHNGVSNYNSQWGNYVIATTHYDRYEGWPWPYHASYGWSEDAASEAINKVIGHNGWWGESGVTDFYNWYNYEGGYYIGDHYYQSDGYIYIIHTT